MDWVGGWRGPQEGREQGIPPGSVWSPWNGDRVRRGHSRSSATGLRMRLGTEHGGLEGVLKIGC